MEQAQRLVHKLKTNKKYDFENDWKVLTIFIGGNDLCACCRKYKHYNILYTPAHYIRGKINMIIYTWLYNRPASSVEMLGFSLTRTLFLV